MNAPTYIFRTFLFALFAMLSVLVLNYVIDPYGITGAPRIADLNQHKVDINNHTRLNKKYQPYVENHNAMVVGNSRVEMGIDPAHRCFLRDGLDVYNLGMPGASVAMQLASALNLMYRQPIETVFLSVDFIDFISTDPMPPVAKKLMHQQSGELKYLPSGEVNPDYYAVVFRDYYKSLLSLDALVSTGKTIVFQSSTAADRENSGFNPARDMEEAVRVEGARALFDQKMQNLRTKYGQPWYLRNSTGQLPVTFEEIDDFLSVAAKKDVKVYLFTHPFHGEYRDLMQSEGLMPLYDDWLTSLEALVRAREGDGIELWDFSQESHYIREKVPAAGVRSGPLQWFWEPAHYRRELGDLMVDAIMSDSCDSEVRFGRRVL